MCCTYRTLAVSSVSWLSERHCARSPRSAASARRPTASAGSRGWRERPCTRASAVRPCRPPPCSGSAGNTTLVTDTPTDRRHPAGAAIVKRRRAANLAQVMLRNDFYDSQCLRQARSPLQNTGCTGVIPPFLPPGSMHSFMQSFAHSFVHPFMHPFLPSCLPAFLPPSFIRSFVHSCIRSFVHS